MDRPSLGPAMDLPITALPSGPDTLGESCRGVLGGEARELEAGV